MEGIHMKTKKILSTILASTLLIGTMVGCGTSSNTSSGNSADSGSGKTAIGNLLLKHLRPYLQLYLH